MTCIVGIEHNGGVLIAGDSQTTAGWSAHMKSDQKVFRVGPFAIGLAGSPRMGQLLHYKLIPPPLDDETDLYRYMATEFIDAVRTTLKDGGHAEKLNEKESHDSSFLVGIRDHLFTVQSDYQISRWACEYAAIGCGQDLAVGALHATRTMRSPEKRAQLALEAAAEHSIGVAAPFHFVKAA